MTLLFIGLIIGIIVGRLIGQSKLSGSSINPQSPPPVRRRAPAGDSGVGNANRSFDPVSDLMNEMQTGVQLLAEDQRNRNFREAVRIKADRRKLQSAYQSSSSR
ncbi:MAG: hypothetical protein M3Q99_07100 [Acidobacteriota bacterium]|nr:hypothetical protein [Acidobacteriota bacterium]